MVANKLQADNVDACGQAVLLHARYLVRVFNAGIDCVFIVVQISCIFANV